MYIGDSITHGVDSASYRWPLFKIWVDNGIRQQEVGVNTGNWRGGVRPNTAYGKSVFRNVHSAISSERAYEIAGRINRSGRLENSNIFDWLGLDKDYTGKRRIDPEREMPSTFFLLIGTNDTLSDSVKTGIHTTLPQIQDNLLGRKGDMRTIIDAMRKASPKANIAVSTIPTWATGRDNNDAPEDFAAIERYNEALKAWGRARKVAVVEVNRGMVDVPASEKIPFVGVPSMFVGDKLHPSAQGDLILAGNMAQQLGFAGRTAGLERRAASEFPLQAEALTSDSDGVRISKKGMLLFDEEAVLNHSATCECGHGATVELRFAKSGYGNGARGGWSDKPMLVALSADSQVGLLGISEGYITWAGNSILYSADMAELTEPIRMVYVGGNPARGLKGGFYVWLGDMLIGEALPGVEVDGGAKLSVGTSGIGVGLRQLSYDPAASWAPPTKRFSAHGAAASN